MSYRQVRERPDGLAHTEGSVSRIEVVFANKDNGKVMEAGERHRLVENALLSSPIAEVDDDDGPVFLGRFAAGFFEDVPAGAGDDRFRFVPRKVREATESAYQAKLSGTSLIFDKTATPAEPVSDIRTMERQLRPLNLTARRSSSASASSRRQSRNASHRPTLMFLGERGLDPSCYQLAEVRVGARHLGHGHAHAAQHEDRPQAHALHRLAVGRDVGALLRGPAVSQ